MSKSELIAAIHRENLCTYFVLPLLKLNKQRFAGEPNFMDSYLNEALDTIYVQVKSTVPIQHSIVRHPQYMGVWKDVQGRLFIEYRIPDNWKPDLRLFRAGKFSKMSNEAKERIRLFSGLQYRERRETDGVIVTDLRILALDKSIAIREMWEEHYGVVLDDEQELLSIPASRSFINKDILQPLEDTQ